MNQQLRRVAYRAGMFFVSIALVAVLWELYKVVGPEKGGKLFGVAILPRSNDTAMPHIWEMLSRYAEPEMRSPNSKLIWFVVLKGAFYSFRLALVNGKSPRGGDKRSVPLNTIENRRKTQIQ